jgi:hypothetical protein
MTRFDVCGLGNAIVDIFLELSDEEFASLGFDRGTMRLVDPDEQQKLLLRFSDRGHDLRLVSCEFRYCCFAIGRNRSIHRMRWGRPLWPSLCRGIPSSSYPHG